MSDRLRYGALALLAVGYGLAALAGVHLPLAARLVVGLPLTVVAPGWALLGALRLKRRSAFLSLVLAVGTSLAEVIALDLLLALGVGQRLGAPLLPAALCGLVVLQATAAAAHRAPATRVHAAQPATGQVALRLVPALALACLAAIIAVVSSRDLRPQPYTELWASITPAGAVVTNVVNREGKPVRYRIQLRYEDGVLPPALIKTVAPGVSWHASVALPANMLPPGPGAGVSAGSRITVDLYRGDSRQPYREVAGEVGP